MLTVRHTLLAALIFLFALGGFLAARTFNHGSSSDAQQPPAVGNIGPRQTAAAKEAQFVGTFLGISLAPSLDQLPAHAQQSQAQLTAGACDSIPVTDAKRLGVASPVAPPAGFSLANGYPQATACNGAPSGLKWEYHATAAEGIAEVSLLRVTTTYETVEAPASKVSTEDIGGRKAIVVRPPDFDGVAERSYVFFPEPFGMTEIHAFNLSESDLLSFARAVAEATQ